MNILILSRNVNLYSTQSLVSAFQKRRHTVWVLDHQRFDLLVHEDRLTPYYNNYPIQEMDAIVPRIGATSTQFGAAVIRHFELSGIYSTTSSDALLKARDKFYCMQLMSSAGIPVPKTLMANLQNLPADTVKSQFSAPLVLKLKESTHGLGVILSETYANTLASLEAFHHLKQETLIQEFIREAKGCDLRIFVVDGSIAGAMRREAAAGDFRSNLHRGGSSFIESLTPLESEIALRATAALGLKVAGVDILRSARGPLVLEVNASPGLEGIETTTKLDISGKIVSMVEKDLSH